MRVSLTFLVALFCNVAFGQSVVTNSKEVYDSGFQPIRQADGKTVESARGVWRVDGYGYLAELTERDVRLFNETDTLLWKSQDVNPGELIVAVAKSGNEARFAPEPGVPPFVARRIEAMPKGKHEPKKWTPTKIYDAFAQTMGENYVFFKERSFDWDARLAQQRPKVTDSSTANELFNVVAETLMGIDDGHVQLGAEIDGKERRAELGVPATIKRGIEIFAQQSEFKEFDDFMQNRLMALQNGIANDILGGSPRQSCKQLTWGVTAGNVGYLFIRSMTNYSEADSSHDQLAELHAAMDAMLTELSSTSALIIDISINGGGRDAFSRAIASHFADKRRLAFTKGPLHNPTQHSIYVEPYQGQNGKGVTYTKPVYLVTNDVTMSAAEIFVLCMKDLPHVTTVGKATSGALSDVLSKTLPNGWSFGLSNEIYRDSQGVCYEAKGIPPEVDLTVIDPAKPDLGHAAAIAKVAAMAK